MTNGERILLVGNPEPIHVGAHLAAACTTSGLEWRLCDSREAYGGSAVLQRLNWWLRGRRPNRLRSFSEYVVECCREFQPSCLLSTGLAPVDATALREIGRMRVKRLNYLTDDPGNPAHRAPWFLEALPLYDHVFTPRRANIQDLGAWGCRQVSFMPFAYAPETHFVEPPSTPEEREVYAADVLFAGGADPDRVPYVSALLKAGFKVALYGGYWERYRETRAHARGHADPATLRKATGGARMTLVLVRRANRDGHSMRTFEVPAMGGCLLVEDTAEHREIFGPEGKTVTYFGGIPEMIEKARHLDGNEAECRRLADAAHDLIVGGRNTYRDRLADMMAFLEAKVGAP